MTRNEIEQKIKENSDKIEVLKNENTELEKQAILLSDEKQQYKEEIEHHPRAKYQREENFLDGKTVGRIHWKQELTDMDTGQPIVINRSRIVRVNGEWIY